jgi:ABC-type multidrug transport system fused ATPase/permease subunit
MGNLRSSIDVSYVAGARMPGERSVASINHAVSASDSLSPGVRPSKRSLMSLYRRALSYFRPDLHLVVAWIALIALSTGLGLLAAWPMAILIDSVLSAPTNNDWIHRTFLSILPASRLGQIVALAVIGLGLKLGQDALTAIQTLVSNQVNYNGLIRVRCDLYRKLQALNLAYHRSQPQGDAIYRLSSDAYGCQTILGVIVSGVVAAGTLAVMTWVLSTRSVSLTLLAFSILPFLAITNVVFGRRLKARSIECKERDSAFTTAVQRSMASIGLMQAFGREAEEFGNFHGTVRETIRAWWNLNRQQIAYNIIVGSMFGLAGASIFGYGGYLVYAGKLSTGDLMVFTSYLGMLWGPLCTLTGFSASIQGGVAGAERVFDVLDRDPGICNAPNAKPLPKQPRVLELDHVSFRYNENAPVLNNVSVRITPGQMVAFVGSSGVGKSTLLNLLPRFYDPIAGAIRMDGADIRDVKLGDLRKHVALVLQESVILPTTIAENIAYGFPKATHEQIREAARLAGAAEFIEALPEGYQTKVAEGGQNLSGGQRQRISIARALLTEAPFVVLDEPTSALDPHHEQVVTDALRKLKGQRTIVIVSHRLSTVVACDQIFVMDQGRVVEHGTHAELLMRRGAYYEMARHQFQLEEDPPKPTFRKAA